MQTCKGGPITCIAGPKLLASHHELAGTTLLSLPMPHTASYGTALRLHTLMRLVPSAFKTGTVTEEAGVAHVLGS